jgi:hypothetical protein
MLDEPQKRRPLWFRGLQGLAASARRHAGEGLFLGINAPALREGNS